MFYKHYSNNPLIRSTAFLVASFIHLFLLHYIKLILLKLHGNKQDTINVISKRIFSCCIMKYSRPINFACNVTNDVYLILSVFGIYRVLKRRQKQFNVSLPVVPFSCLLVFSLQIVSKCCF